MTPILETKRLRMRGHVAGDLDASLAMWRDPDVYRYISGKAGTREECWARLMRFSGHWHLQGFGYWLVEETATGAFVGEVGFADFMREMTPSLEGTLEAGWFCHQHITARAMAPKRYMRRSPGRRRVSRTCQSPA